MNAINVYQVALQVAEDDASRALAAAENLDLARGIFETMRIYASGYLFASRLLRAQDRSGDSARTYREGHIEQEELARRFHESIHDITKLAAIIGGHVEANRGEELEGKGSNVGGAFGRTWDRLSEVLAEAHQVIAALVVEGGVCNE